MTIVLLLLAMHFLPGHSMHEEFLPSLQLCCAQGLPICDKAEACRTGAGVRHFGIALVLWHVSYVGYVKAM